MSRGEKNHSIVSIARGVAGNPDVGVGMFEIGPSSRARRPAAFWARYWLRSTGWLTYFSTNASRADGNGTLARRVGRAERQLLGLDVAAAEPEQEVVGRRVVAHPDHVGGVRPQRQRRADRLAGEELGDQVAWPHLVRLVPRRLAGPDLVGELAEDERLEDRAHWPDAVGVEPVDGGAAVGADLRDEQAADRRQRGEPGVDGVPRPRQRALLLGRLGCQGVSAELEAGDPARSLLDHDLELEELPGWRAHPGDHLVGRVTGDDLAQRQR